MSGCSNGTRPSSGVQTWSAGRSSAFRSTLTENPLHDELRELAEQVVSSTDEDVLSSGEDIARLYRRERMVALGLAAVDAMVSDGPDQILEDDPRLVAVR